MTKFLLAVHVVAAIVAIGPVTVAASMFPAAVRRVQAAAARTTAATTPDFPPVEPAGPAITATVTGSVATVRLLHRICRVYAVVGLLVPVFGLATASSLNVLSDAWLIVSMVLTAAAAGILVLLVLPRQERILAELEQSHTTVDRATTMRLGMVTGVFNVLWVVVTILMIVRPGSTTGV